MQTPLVDKNIVIALLFLYPHTITFYYCNIIDYLLWIEYYLMVYFLYYSYIIIAPKVGYCILGKVYIIYCYFLLDGDAEHNVLKNAS